MSKRSNSISILLLGMTLVLPSIWLHHAISLHSQDYRSSQYTKYIQQNHTFSEPALVNFMLASMPLSNEDRSELARFKLDSIEFNIPKDYISSKPRQSNGKVITLALTFQLPHMESKRAMDSKLSFLDPKQSHQLLSSLEVHVFVSPQNKAIQGVDPKLRLFQYMITGFQKYSTQLRERKSNLRFLKNGQYDPELNLVEYSGYKKLYSGNKLWAFNTIYLVPDADASCPQEWFVCRKDMCTKFWFRNSLLIKTTFKRSLLPIHAIIQAKVNEKMDEFINKPTPQKKDS